MTNSDKRLRGRVSVEIQDSRQWDVAIRSLWEQLEPALKRQIAYGEHLDRLEDVEVVLLSPHGESPLRAAVEMTVAGDTWREIQDVASAVLEEAVATAAGGEDSLPSTKRSLKAYEEQGTELVPA